MKTVTGMYQYHPGIMDPGEMIIVQQHSFLIGHMISAVLITGGYDTEQSAEIYHPDRYSPCIITNIPDQRRIHTQDGSLICGGGLTLSRSCRRWTPDTGTWDLMTESLIEERGAHISWTTADGSVTYLMGGYWSHTTSEMLEHDNSKVSTSFPLKHDTK